ncbi:MAG: hypothetical protein ACRD3V_07445 [Vicinamibacteria bacterium]
MIGKALLLLSLLEGAWELESYRLQGKDVPATGVMIFSDGRFAMVYTMDHQGRSGRAHGGEYRLEGHRITFDIPWWIQRVPGEPQVMDGKRAAGAAVKQTENSLTIEFDGGSVQVFRRLPSRSGDDLDGAWLLESYEGSARTGPTTGMVLFRDGRFALLYTMKPEGGLDGRAHAGTFARARDAVNLGVKWEVVSLSGEAVVAEKTYERETGVVIANDRLTLDYGKGASQTFRRAGP